ncbi:MAG: hypothetical protein AB7S57_13925 [Acetobacteraceae bacterium]
MRGDCDELIARAHRFAKLLDLSFQTVLSGRRQTGVIHCALAIDVSGRVALAT